MIQNPGVPSPAIIDPGNGQNSIPVDQKDANAKNPAELPDHPSQIEEHLVHEDHIHKILLIGSIIVTVIAALCIACATYLGILYQSDRLNSGPAIPKKNFHDECGVTHFQPNQRIMLGQSAVPSSWPSVGILTFSYYAETIYYEGKNFTVNYTSKSYCSCVLIDRLTVLTAANCIRKNFTYHIKRYDLEFPIKLTEYNPTIESMYTVNFGFSKLSEEDDLVKRYYIQTISVEKIIIHPNYNANGFKNNIAILKLSREAGLGKHVQIACLPTSSSTSFPPVDTGAVAVGWGLDDDFGIESIQNAQVKVVDGKTCSSKLDNESKLCAISEKNRKGNVTAERDDGGGLFTLGTVNGTQKYILAGLISHPDFESNVYMRISSYLNWILENSNLAH